MYGHQTIIPRLPNPFPPTTNDVPRRLTEPAPPLTAVYSIFSCTLYSLCVLLINKRVWLQISRWPGGRRRWMVKLLKNIPTFGTLNYYAQCFGHVIIHNPNLLCSVFYSRKEPTVVLKLQSDSECRLMMIIRCPWPAGTGGRRRGAGPRPVT